MKIEFDTRYLEVVGGDIKAAMMLAVGITKQIEADKTDEPSEYGNYWGMTVGEWQTLGFGAKDAQKSIRKLLLETEIWLERSCGYPAHKVFCVKLNKLEAIIEIMKKDERNESERIEKERDIAHAKKLKMLIGGD